METSAIQSSMSGTSSQGLGRAQMDTYQFLKLLITELTTQNPLDPVKDRDFMAQMAQLNTAQSVERLGHVLTGLQAASLIGREVTALLSSGERIQGQVQSVEMSSGKVYLRINDKQVPFEAVQQIA
jgi:flagellar basal-body rod modification protein FlgD